MMGKWEQLVETVDEVIKDQYDKSREAERTGDKDSMYRFNTALHALWKVQDKMRALDKAPPPEPT